MICLLLFMVSSCPECRYLGLLIDENLSWNQHTANVVQRVYFRILCLNHLHPLRRPSCSIISCFLLPILDYCDVVWTPSSMQHFKCLERLHSRFNSPPSSNDLSTSVTLTERRQFHAAVQGHRVLYTSYHHHICMVLSLCCWHNFTYRMESLLFVCSKSTDYYN